MKLYPVLALLLTLTACNKRPASETGDSPAQAVPFQRGVFQTLDQREAITLISADELEHREDGLNLVCKYSRQGDALRVVESMAGTTQAFYFKLVPEGLRTNDGKILFSPKALTEEKQDLVAPKLLAIALKMYALDHDGDYPHSLSEDLWPRYAPNKSILEYTDRHTSQRRPWLYQNSLTDTSDAGALLIAAPVTTPDGKRTVGFVDGSVRKIPETEFQRLWNRK